MKLIKLLLICTVISAIIQSPAQAQSRPQFCQIHAGNISNYVSQSNLFNSSSPPTPYCPFLQNYQTYKVSEELIATPLFYTALPDGNIDAAFQLKGKYGNLVISDRDVVVQHIKYYRIGSYAQTLEFCLNGAFVLNQNSETYRIMELPLNAQLALGEASLGVIQEQTR